MILNGGVFPTQDDPEATAAGKGHTAGERVSPCGMHNVSRCSRCASLWPPAVVRKHIGHESIPAEFAAQFQRFYTTYFNWERHLKEGISAAMLEQQARQMSDTECAPNMQQRKRKLLASCRSRWQTPARPGGGAYTGIPIMGGAGE